MTRRGFTLLEVLLVAAIVAVLTGLIFAVLATARERARGTNCESNLHQIGLALNMYRADYDGVDPITGGEVHAWQLGLPPIEYITHNGNPYIKDARILFCPDYAGPPLQFSTYQWPYVRDFLGQDAFPRTQRWSHVCSRRGQETALVADDNHNPPINTRAPRWNTKRVTVLRLGGNVQTHAVPIRTFWYDW